MLRHAEIRFRQFTLFRRAFAAACAIALRACAQRAKALPLRLMPDARLP